MLLRSFVFSRGLPSNIESRTVKRLSRTGSMLLLASTHLGSDLFPLSQPSVRAPHAGFNCWPVPSDLAIHHACSCSAKGLPMYLFPDVQKGLCFPFAASLEASTSRSLTPSHSGAAVIFLSFRWSKTYAD
jgi:hypothetical protein